MAAHSELAAWLMPPTAQNEWLRLTALLDQLPDSEIPCRAGNAGDWWPDAKGVHSADTLAAIDACRGCRARVACLDYALAADERFGIWAGTLPGDRTALRLRATA